MGLLSTLTAVVFVHATLTLAQSTLSETVYGAFLFTYYGDRTPFVESNPNLTPLGAQQLFTAGSNFRARYVDPSSSSSSTAVSGISAYELDNEQISVLTYYDQYCVASAQAFMQGLYPPIENAINYTLSNGESALANGSIIDAPLSGYQYPQIYTAADVDLNSLWVAGNLNCPAYTSAMSDYYSSQEYDNIEASTSDLYMSLEPLMNGVVPNASLGYFDAYYIYDYLSYGMTHNTSIANSLSNTTFDQLRNLADQWVFAMNANTTSSSDDDADIRAIAGRTFAAQLARDMYTNINTLGAESKMTFTFGSFEPIVSFASLAGLAKESTAQFFGQPQYGSSMVFELYALEENSTSTYPAVEDLLVRFLFQNGTDSSADLVEFALFGNGPSQAAIPFTDFLAALEDFMTVTVEDWCEACSSDSVFCAAYESSTGSSSSGSSSSSDSSSSGSSAHGRVSPVVAGVIGAIVTLALLFLVLGALMLLFGLRFFRQHNKRRSELGGFKGEKLASDQDLTLPKNRANATVIPAEATATKGHERVGSWEMGQPSANPQGEAAAPSTRRPSFEEDDLHVTPYAKPVKADDKV